MSCIAKGSVKRGCLLGRALIIATSANPASSRPAQSLHLTIHHCRRRHNVCTSPCVTDSHLCQRQWFCHCLSFCSTMAAMPVRSILAKANISDYRHLVPNCLRKSSIDFTMPLPSNADFAFASFCKGKPNRMIALIPAALCGQPHKQDWRVASAGYLASRVFLCLL